MKDPSHVAREAAEIWLQHQMHLLSDEEAAGRAKALALCNTLDDAAANQVLGVLQPWWDGCRDARHMMQWCDALVRLMIHEHRRTLVRLACKIARTVIVGTGDFRAELHDHLCVAEAWMVDSATDTQHALQRAMDILQHTDKVSVKACCLAVLCLSESFGSKVAIYASLVPRAGFPTSSKVAGDIADLIRGEVPVCPMPVDLS